MNSDTIRSAQEYWDTAANHYDEIFPCTLIGRSQRDAVWHELGRVFYAGQRILELNCGTGIDALHLAERGIRIVACDISPRMIELARHRSGSNRYGDLIDYRVLATEDIARLADEAPFDGAFSNFSGMNCVEDLSTVARNLSRLLKSGSMVLLCMMGRFCLWEIAWYMAHGDPHKALRRLRPGSTGSHGDNASVNVYHWSVAKVVNIFLPNFRLRRRVGIGVSMPPSYSEHWVRHFPRIFDGLRQSDRWLGHVPILRNLGDCVLLQFEHVRN
jgi:ubiquinone/menaquinone biosynthesis C-methylase UbiE